MNTFPEWTSPGKPSEITYNRLVESILNGALPTNSHLPNELQLAEALGVTRSTLREALQRLEANGMIEIHHGKPTRVRDIWVEGNMNTLSSVVNQQYKAMSDRWVPQMLEVRLALACAYTRAAVLHNATGVDEMLSPFTAGLPDDALTFARVDWEVHHRLTILSTNPIFTLILNGFREYYTLMAVSYFSQSETRQHSRNFYSDLQLAARHGDADRACQVTAKVMEDSLQFWIQYNNNRSK